MTHVRFAGTTKSHGKNYFYGGPDAARSTGNDGMADNLALVLTPAS